MPLPLSVQRALRADDFLVAHSSDQTRERSYQARQSLSFHSKDHFLHEYAHLHQQTPSSLRVPEQYYE